MLEFDIFVPLSTPDGKRISPRKINALKRRLLRKFGGVTYFPQSNEGLWKMGGYTFRDRIVILRIIAKSGRSTIEFFSELKRQMQRDWQQMDVLIISRSIKIL